jgi:hypothetical protein
MNEDQSFICLIKMVLPHQTLCNNIVAPTLVIHLTVLRVLLMEKISYCNNAALLAYRLVSVSQPAPSILYKMNNIY